MGSALEGSKPRRERGEERGDADRQRHVDLERGVERSSIVPSRPRDGATYPLRGARDDHVVQNVRERQDARERPVAREPDDARKERLLREPREDEEDLRPEHSDSAAPGISGLALVA